jgi:hypothetical protein
MSKFFFSFLVALLTISAHAQISKGSILLGGDVGFGDTKNSYNYGSNDYTGGGFSLSVGKTIKENKVVGISLGFTSSKQISEPTLATYDTLLQKTIEQCWFLLQGL